MQNLYIDDVNICSFYLCMKERPVIPAPKRRVNKIEIPGRDGSLTEFEGYDDIEISIKLNALEECEDIQSLSISIKDLIYSAKTIRLTDRPGYYKVKAVEISEMENSIVPFLDFEAIFTCDPFLYAYSKLKKVNNGEKIFNPGTYFSRPLIRAKFSGKEDGEIRINENIITLKEPDPSETYIIDCEMMDTYAERSLGNRNAHIKGNYPEMPKGFNIVRYSGSVAKLEIDGRWRYL